MLYSSTISCIGNTPLVELINIEKKYQLKCRLFAKLEGFNLTNSSKIRIAFKIIETALKENLINENSIIIEATSGNTGIALASICAFYKLKFIAVMPNNMSIERKKLIEIYGSEVVLSDEKKGIKGSLEKLEELKKKFPNHFIPSQFINKNNPLAHYQTTGKEIISDLPSLDCFVASIGTGGTITGTSKCLKEYNKQITTIGVEPEESPLLTKNKVGEHGIQGIGANFIPSVLDCNYIDRIELISTSISYDGLYELAKEEGLFVGISSGCAFKCALKIAQENNFKNIVVLFPDLGDRYISKLY